MALEMSNLQILFYSGLFLVWYLAIVRLRQYANLKHFKGPATTGISWWWYSTAVLSGRAHEYYGEVTEKYGPIARVAPNHLITSDADFWANINAVRSPYRRAPWYYHAARFEPGKDNVFTECDNDRHDARRKKMAAGYSGRDNPTLEPSVDEHVKELVNLVRKYAASATSNTPSTRMNLAKKIPYFTLDVISHVGLGQPFGNLLADKDLNEYHQASEVGLKISNTAFALGIDWLRSVPIIGPAISPSEKDATGFGKMMGEARKLINARVSKSTEEKSDMLASFIRHGVSGDDLFQEAFEQVLAGSDTTAAAIRIIMLYIISHPRIYKKLQAEIDDAVNSGTVPASVVISDASARKLPYLCAVIREGMRIHPPVTNIFSRITPSHGETVTISDTKYFIPGGTLIGYSAWSMHRNNCALYGSDASTFRPERWLHVDDAERLAQMTKTNDMVFGYGRWQCLGKNIALLEIHKSVFELFRYFDFALSDPAKPWRTFDTMGLWQIEDMWVDVTLRWES